MYILSATAPAADHRISYGPGPNQFGDLWIPAAQNGSLSPLVVFFHGGWWKSQYDLAYAGHLCAALRAEGIAAWSLEYRRVGGAGGWPTTFQDAAAGFDFAATLARQYPIDLRRVMTMGHSAGGHLAFWIAGRRHIDASSEVGSRPQVTLRGTVALAGAVDLRMTIDLAGSSTFAHTRQAVYALMGGRPEELEPRYEAGNPGDLLPFRVPHLLVQGLDDDQIPSEMPAQWAKKARRMGEEVTVSLVPGADHFDVVDPASQAWLPARDFVRKLLFAPPS